LGHAELSQIYPALKRLESLGLLISRAEVSPKGPARKVYTRTAAGREALLDWLTGGTQLGTERFAYLAQVFFMDELDDVTATRHFMLELREQMTARVAALEEVECQVRDAAGKPPEEFSGDSLHQFLAIRMGIHSISAKVTWCDEAIAPGAATFRIKIPLPFCIV
jgi:DNA-binding PadR family transcriptional regulator